MNNELKEAERVAFEAWARPVGFYLTRNEILGHYANIDTTRAWEGWQARAALTHRDAQAVPQGWRELLQQSKENCRYNHGHSSLADWIYASIEDLFARSIAAPTPPAQQDAQAVPPGWHEFLKEIEWANSGHGENGDGEAYCVCCEAWQHEGHQPGCKFFAMLNAATAPKQRVMLTLDEIDEVWSSIAGHSIYAEYQMEIARAMIEAYERKNGIK